MRRRCSSAGVTLIEMLVALAISALIGLAGFILLESVTRTEAGVAGRLDQLTLQDRAFQLLARDAQSAISSTLTDVLQLRLDGGTVTWDASDSGLARHITRAGELPMTQRILDEPAAFAIHAPGMVSLALPDAGIWRLVAVPQASLP